MHEALPVGYILFLVTQGNFLSDDDIIESLAVYLRRKALNHFLKGVNHEDDEACYHQQKGRYQNGGAQPEALLYRMNLQVFPAYQLRGISRLSFEEFAKEIFAFNVPSPTAV